MDCIFCKIINKEQESNIVYQDNQCVAFRDINPKAPVHILIVPRMHIQTNNQAEAKHEKVLGHLFVAARKIAKEQNIDKIGYRLIINTGSNAGQTIDHFHMHLMGGKKLPSIKH